MRIISVRPRMVLPGGLVRVGFEDLPDPLDIQVYIGGVEARITAASSTFATCRVPEASGDVLKVVSAGQTAETPLGIGTVLANDLHSVSNPVVDALGNVYVTYSGARGEEVPFGVFVVHPDGRKEPFLGDIVNATGLVIGPDERLYISSRHTGCVYRSTFDKQVEEFADNLGLATGLVFGSGGDLFVGDRSGMIYRVTPAGNTSLLCELEPSVSAYHMAVNSADELFVAGPTLATQDNIYRISSGGKVAVYFKGLGRPQGLFFDREGRLNVAASFRGRKGLYTFLNGSPELSVSGPMLVGGAYDPSGKTLYLVDNENLYWMRSA